MHPVLVLLFCMLAWGADARSMHNPASFANAYKAPYIGQVVTRTKFPDTALTTGSFSSNNRTMFYTRDTIHSISVVWTGKYIDATGIEQNGPGNYTINNAYIEYPLGTCTPLLFSGSASGTVPSNGDLQGDLNIYIPKGVLGAVRIWAAALTTFTYNDSANGPVINASLGDGADFNASNEGATCSAVSAGATSTIFPVAIIGKTRLPSIMFVGDSRASGLKDSFNGTSGDIGNLARTIGPQFAYANFGRSAAQANNFAAGVQTTLQKYFTHIIQERGGADIDAGGQSAAQTVTAIASIYQLFPGKPIFQSTFEPTTTSTDGWITTTNQAFNTGNSAFLTINGNFRGMTNSPRGIIDVTNVLANTRANGLWAFGSGPTAWTGDGLHCIQVGCIAIVSGKVINNRAFFRYGPR